MMRTPLLAAAVAATLALALSGSASAAPKPQITDAAGDAAGLGAGYDIVSGLFATGGTTARVGKKTVYTPTKLVITVTYAAAVAADDYAAQVIEFEAPGCGAVYLERYANGPTYGIAECHADDASFDFSAKVSGKTLQVTLPFNVIGKAYLKKGATLTGLRTYTAVADPAVGYETGEFLPVGTVDNATTTASYVIR